MTDPAEKAKAEAAKKVQGSDAKKVLSPTNSKKILSTDANKVETVDEGKGPVVEGLDSDDEDKEADGEEVKEEEEDYAAERTSLAPTVGGPKPSCCYRFLNAIFRFFAHDSIYGSFVGPHPVSFLFCCIPCKSCCKGTCKRPFLLASVATKMMWFIMLLFIMILSCFFIIPYPEEAGLAPIIDFFPCNDGEKEGKTHYRFVRDNITMDCSSHGGYFMVYRNFFAFCFLLLVSCLIMINVKSTNFNRKRAKMHHGFWLYKYILLFVLLLIAYLGIRVEVGGIFEYIVSWIGLLSALIFSFVEITFLLELVETYAVKNRSSTSDWADCLYWTFTSIVLIIDIAVIVALCKFYAKYEYEIINFNNRKPNEIGEVSILHVGVIIYAIFMTIALLAMSIYNRFKGKFRYAGVLQTTFVISYFLGIVWNALGNSPDVQARPHYNPYSMSKSFLPQKGSWDVYFKAEEFCHGLSAFLALIYYLFWNGPRSKTAPLSILFDKIMYLKAKKPETPVIPSAEDAPEEYNTAIEELKVWDDEKTGVRYSWTIFYVFMILGSFSIMMAMCNFSDPWAMELYASSIPAFSIKILISFTVAVTYIVTTTFPCRKIYPELFEEPLPGNDVVQDGGFVGQNLNENGDVIIQVVEDNSVQGSPEAPDPTKDKQPETEEVIIEQV